MKYKDRYDLSPRIQENGEPASFQMTPEREEILLSFEDFKLRPTNWIQAQFPHKSLNSINTSLSHMTYLNNGYLTRRTFDGSMNHNETMTYSRTLKGDKLLESLGHDTLPKSMKEDEEQALVDIVRMSHWYGLRNDPTTKLLFRRHYFEDPQHKEVYKQIFKPDGSPHKTLFHFQVGTERVYPDEFPTIQIRGSKAITIIEEMNRATKYDMKRYREKIAKYKRMMEQKLYRAYGFPAPFVRFITTSEVRKRHIMEGLKSLFENETCGWLLFGTIQDHTAKRFRQEVTTRYYDEPYQRIGLPPFSLKMMADVDK